MRFLVEIIRYQAKNLIELGEAENILFGVASDFKS